MRLYTVTHCSCICALSRRPAIQLTCVAYMCACKNLFVQVVDARLRHVDSHIRHLPWVLSAIMDAKLNTLRQDLGLPASSRHGPGARDGRQETGDLVQASAGAGVGVGGLQGVGGTNGGVLAQQQQQVGNGWGGQQEQQGLGSNRSNSVRGAGGDGGEGVGAEQARGLRPQQWLPSQLMLGDANGAPVVSGLQHVLQGQSDGLVAGSQQPGGHASQQPPRPSQPAHASQLAPGSTHGSAYQPLPPAGLLQPVCNANGGSERTGDSSLRGGGLVEQSGGVGVAAAAAVAGGYMAGAAPDAQVGVRMNGCDEG